MYHALDMGLTAADFWDMSARAVVNLQREMIRTRRRALDRQAGSRAEETRGPRLHYLPRP